MKLAEFAKWVIEEGPFTGHDLDGADIQEKAVECGLLTETKYDPAIHGEPDGLHDFVEPGDEWFVFSPELQAALSSPMGREGS